MNNTSIANFFFELGMLRRMKRSGMTLAGVTEPESVAEHSSRAAIIGYILAVMEGANPETVACILMMHDIAEIRVGDQNKVSARYFKKDEAEVAAFNEQLEDLPEAVQTKWKEYWNHIEERKTKEGIVAKDADWLEAALTAREFVVQGYPACQNWIDNVKKALETESAKQLLAEIEQGNPWDWWKDLKKMTYTKLIQN